MGEDTWIFRHVILEICSGMELEFSPIRLVIVLGCASRAMMDISRLREKTS